jgi:hypothetical protein
VAAASGAGASDASVVNIVGRIKGEGAYRAATALYAGEDKARVLRMQAAAKRYEGLTAEEAGGLNAQDATAKYEAAAVAEEAKGVAAYSAGRTAATSSQIRGAAGALGALNAIPTAISLFGKYGFGTDPTDAGAGLPTDGEVGADVLAQQSESAEAYASEMNALEYDADYYDAASGMSEAAAAAEAAAEVSEAAEAADLFADFEWLAAF